MVQAIAASGVGSVCLGRRKPINHEGPVSTVSFVQLVSFVVDWFRNLDLILQGATTCSRLRGEFGLKLTHYPASE
jgi:hypothetical protein